MYDILFYDHLNLNHLNMRNTLPLSSFPLHLILTIDHYYTIVLTLFTFALLLFKTYNLPYSSSMGAQ